MSLAGKLQVKPGARVLLLSAPEGYEFSLPGAPVETQPSGLYDVVQVFVRTQQELADSAAAAVAALRPGGVLWLCYPKVKAKIPTDISRDRGWGVLNDAGWAVVSAVSINEVWTGLRFKPGGRVAE
ncbi:MAG: hypothetical protein NVSMB32_05650 [Actinomycetota bacterium]